MPSLPLVPLSAGRGVSPAIAGEDEGFREGDKSQKLSITGDFFLVAKVSHVPAPSSAVTAEVGLRVDPSICIS